MITYVEGDIFDYVTQGCVMLHQVNCQGVMGSGLALQVKQKYPNAFKAYKEYCNENKDDRKRMLGMNYITTVSDQTICFDIGNCFGQLSYGRRGVHTNYEALRRCFEFVTEHYVETVKVLIPYKIGCGLAGGDWNIVLSMIEDVFKAFDVTIVKYNSERT